MAVSFINIGVNFQSSFSMLIINSGLRSKAVIFLSNTSCVHQVHLRGLCPKQSSHSSL